MGERHLAGEAGSRLTGLCDGDWFPLCVAWGREGALCPGYPHWRGRAEAGPTVKDPSSAWLSHSARLWDLEAAFLGSGIWRLPFWAELCIINSLLPHAASSICLSACLELATNTEQNFSCHRQLIAHPGIFCILFCLRVWVFCLPACMSV